MRGCLRRLGILVILLGILIVVVGVAIGLYWYRGEQLDKRAWRAYYEGKPAEALALYRTITRQYPSYWWVFGDFAKWAPYKVRELEDYLHAVSLKDSGQTEEAITAYESFLDKHWGQYASLARETLASLSLEYAQSLHRDGEYAEAIAVYRSVLELEAAGSMAVEESHAQAKAAMPVIFLEWAEVLEQQEDYEGAIEKYQFLLKEYPGALDREQAEAKLAALYEEWAAHLRGAEDYEGALEKYEIILREYPDTPTAAQAETAIAETRQEFAAWREKTKAVPVVEFAKEVGRDAEGRWVLVTVFRETGGKVGYTLSGEGWVIDTKGQRWGPFGTMITRGPVTVPAGGQAVDDYWCTGDAFVDGYAAFTWSGEDDNGHPITIEEKVHLLP